ncbi:MAG: hypothetical protein ABII18_08385 [bacterium]
MKIFIKDPKAIEIYKKFICPHDEGDNCPDPESNKIYIIGVDNFHLTDDATKTFQQLFAYEAMSDVNNTLSYEEARQVDQVYYKSSLPFAQRSLYTESSIPDPEHAVQAYSNSPFGIYKFIADYTEGNGVYEDLIDAVSKYPKLGLFIDQRNADCWPYLIALLNIFQNHPEERKIFLDDLGHHARNTPINEPIAYNIALKQEFFTQGLATKLNQTDWLAAQDYQGYHAALQNPEELIKMVEDTNYMFVQDALLAFARNKIHKDIILEKLETTDEFYTFSAALQALATWGNEESVQILEDNIRHGSYQAHIMASFAMREHLPIERLVESLDRLLYDNDPFVRGAALKILQFVWQKPGFEEYAECFIGETKSIEMNDPNKYVRQAATEALSYVNTDPPTGRDEPYDFLSGSYLYPGQQQWITDHLKILAQNGQKTLKVLMVGCSYGTEAFSTLIHIMKDYEANPASWGDFNPKTDLKIIASDIDSQALLYNERGAYHLDGPGHENEFYGMQLYHDVYGTDFNADLDHFFERTPNSGPDQFQLKPEYKQMIEVTYLDVTNKPTQPIADIVTFNKLDYIWGDSKEETNRIYENAFGLTRKYLTYVSFGNNHYGPALEAQGRALILDTPIGFFEKF